MKSLTYLIEKYGDKLKIPKENVILHKEVKQKVVNASDYSMPVPKNSGAHQEHTDCGTNITLPKTNLKDKNSLKNLGYNKPLTLS